MSLTLNAPSAVVAQLTEKIEYAATGVLSKLLLKTAYCQYTLFCLAAGTDISEHTSTRNAVVQVLEGRGTLTLEGQAIALKPGLFIFMPANAPHALSAEDNLAFLLTLSDAAPAVVSGSR
ncbi:MAG TPA: cupin domain-containing protein [Trichocoleus sp.]